MTTTYITPTIPPSFQPDIDTVASEKSKGLWSKMKMALKLKKRGGKGADKLEKAEEAIEEMGEMKVPTGEGEVGETGSGSVNDSAVSLPKSDEVPYHTRLAKSRFYTPPTDEYYGREQTAKACAGLMLAFFPDSSTTTETESDSEINDLARFIAYLLERTRRLPISVHSYALFLLSRLRTRRFKQGCLIPVDPVDPAYRERLYLSALIVANKIVSNRHFMNQSWCLFSRGMFSLDEVDAMEEEMYGEMIGELYKPQELDHFVSVLRQGYGADFLAHDDPAAGMVNAPLRRTYSLASSSSCSSCSSCSSGGPKCQI